jgi:hypothetical protein
LVVTVDFGTKSPTSVCTNPVVATWVVLVPCVAVGAAGVPVNVGEASGAFKASASYTAFCDGATVVVPSLMASATLASAFVVASVAAAAIAAA